jgi:hypothetical protein
MFQTKVVEIHETFILYPIQFLIVFGITKQNIFYEYLSEISYSTINYSPQNTIVIKKENCY